MHIYDIYDPLEALDIFGEKRRDFVNSHQLKYKTGKFDLQNVVGRICATSFRTSNVILLTQHEIQLQAKE